MDAAATLSPDDLARVSVVVQQALSGVVVRSSAILTLEEAIAYTKNTSDSAFYRWTLRFNVHATTPGRFARRELDRGLEREARAQFQSPRRAKKKPAHRVAA